MKSIIVGNETFTDAEKAAQKLSELHAIPIQDALAYIVYETDPTDEFISNIEDLEAAGENITDIDYINRYLEIAEDNITFCENESIFPLNEGILDLLC